MASTDRAGSRWKSKGLLVASALLFPAILIGISYLLVEPGERVGFVAFLVALMALGFANALIPGVKAFLARFLSAYFKFTLGLVVTIGPLLLFRGLSQAMLADAGVLTRIAVLTTWGLLLATASLVVLYGRTRDGLFSRLKQIGVLAPLGYSINLLFVSIQFFATVAFILHETKKIVLIQGTAKVFSVGTFGDFFLWHFLKAVPVLAVTDTLRWDAPFTYNSAAVGWIVLAFKISVIVPVIAAFGWSWKQFREAPPSGR